MHEANIFFFVATVAVILVTIAILIAFFYLIRILRDTNELSQVVKEEGKDIVEDVRSIHSYARLGSSFVTRFVSSLFTEKKKRK